MGFKKKQGEVYASRLLLTDIPFLRQSTQNLLPGFCKRALRMRVCLSLVDLSAVRAWRVDIEWKKCDGGKKDGGRGKKRKSDEWRIEREREREEKRGDTQKKRLRYHQRVIKKRPKERCSHLKRGIVEASLIDHPISGTRETNKLSNSMHGRQTSLLCIFKAFYSH